MLELEEIDIILNMSQRQGKISFYMPSFGEQATTIGVGAGLEDHDLVFPQYREQGTLIWRGYIVKDMLNQCMGNTHDVGKGRQMPIHYGSKKLNFVTVSSPLSIFFQLKIIFYLKLLATQVPQASGSGYAFRLNNENRVSATFFGEGAASEGDFHAALNFAATLQCQTLFLCRNNKYAISTHSSEQYKGDGIAGKSIGYGVQTYRVDGNDAMAVYHVVKQAREYIVKNQKPAFIEFMTYRIGDHSTSDYSVLYRSEEEINFYKQNNPLTRLGLYLKKTGKRQFDEDKDKLERENIRKQISQALKEANETKLHGVNSLFEDVYDNLTPNLKEQQKQLIEHLKEYGKHYKLEKLQQ
ncbi:hypothetical protein IMG5_165320 [Ichthyophthirius multifiliis]|uniref:2-oxoisovalerate dehydrogenase subunit alpha n=1 Tax=Ichthyophthirius multifiliis TaxID=5932 RepID=G0R0K2_ICHMU|nr:hypothetical protein IMG5_165320 [Ichthyophthirius multifiliis]EGR28988.1 hypothetical protein IMG5_165320 [Ichthyophthirius multifiliis]|eukprot:XP_004030224.1 hypothetical protein IMG5_165320 [Ichthyophthirius multifiliis]